MTGIGGISGFGVHTDMTWWLRRHSWFTWFVNRICGIDDFGGVERIWYDGSGGNDGICGLRGTWFVVVVVLVDVIDK